MLSKIHKRCASYVASLLGLRRLLMCRAQDMISEARKYSWKELRRGVTCNFVMALLSLAMLTYIIWGFDYIDGLYDSVVMNLLPAVLPPMVFYEAMQKREARRFDWSYAGFVFFIGLALLLAISDSYDVDELGINVFVIMASSPWLLIFGILVRGERILAIGMVPAAFILMGYWVVPGLLDGLKLQYFLIPLPVVSLVTATWTALVWIFFKGIDRWPKHPTLAPLMESLAMLSPVHAANGSSNRGSQDDSGWRGLVCGTRRNGRCCVWQRGLRATNTFLAELWKSPIVSQKRWRR